MSAELVVLPAVSSSVASTAAASSLIPGFLPIALTLLGGVLIANAVNTIRASAASKDQRIVQSLNQAEEEWKKAQEELNKLRQQEELIRKATEFKSAKDFEEWMKSEVIRYKQLEASILMRLENIKLELREKEEKLRTECKILSNALSLYGYSSDIDASALSELHGVDALQKRLEQLTKRAKEVLERELKELKLLASRVSGIYEKKASELIKAFEVSINSNEPMHAKLERARQVRNNVEKLASEYMSVSHLSSGFVQYKSLRYYDTLDDDEREFDQNLATANLETTDSTTNSETDSSMYGKLELEELKERISETLRLISVVDSKTAESLSKRFSHIVVSEDKLALRAALNELRALYGTLRTKFVEDKVYRELIQNVVRENKRYESVQRLASEYLRMEHIGDKDYKKFIEELFRYTLEEEKLAKLEERMRVAEQIIERLVERGYEVLVAEEAAEVNGEEADSKQLVPGSVLELIPPHSKSHVAKMRISKGGEVILKFFRVGGTRADESADIELCKKWCDDVKDVLNKLDQPAEVKHLLEPEPGTISTTTLENRYRYKRRKSASKGNSASSMKLRKEV